MSEFKYEDAFVNAMPAREGESTFDRLRPFREAESASRAASWVKQGTYGRPSDHPLGVTVFGLWEQPFDGHAEQIRRTALALAETGCPVHLRSWAPSAGGPSNAAYQQQKRVYRLIHASIAMSSCEVWMLPPQPGLVARVMRHRFLAADEVAALNRRRCVATGGWPGEVPAEEVEALKLVGQVWVANMLDLSKLARAGFPGERLRIVPCPAMPPSRERPDRPKGPRSFYAIGDWARQRCALLIEAFMEAFRPGQAKLYLRSAPPDTVWRIVEPILARPASKHHGWTVEHFNRDVKVFAAPVSDRGLAEMHERLGTYCALAEHERMDVAGVDAIEAGASILAAPQSSLMGMVTEDRLADEPLRLGFSAADVARAMVAGSAAWTPSRRVADAGTVMRQALRELVAAAGGTNLYEGCEV